MTEADEAQWRALWFETRAKDMHPIILGQHTRQLIAENE
jgi:hypothetical protein